MAGIDGNSFGINKQDWNLFNNKGLAPAKEVAEPIKITETKSQDSKVGDLGQYLENYGDNLKTGMGLAFSGNVRGAEGVGNVAEIISAVKLDDDVDKEKLSKYTTPEYVTRTGDYVARVIAPAIEEVGTTGNAEQSLIDFEKAFG